MNTRPVLLCAALGAAGAIAAGGASAQGSSYPGSRHHRCDRAYMARTGYACVSGRYLERHRWDRSYASGYHARHRPGAYYDNADFYGPYGQRADVQPAPPSAQTYSVPAAYESPAEVAPYYVRARRFWWEHPVEPSPGADYAVRLESYGNPHTGVTAIPTPNNVSDQVPSHGPDFDGVPPYVPY